MTARLEAAAERFLRVVGQFVTEEHAPSSYREAATELRACLPDSAVPPVYGRADPIYATFPVVGLRRVPGRWRPVVTIAATGEDHPGRPGWGEARTEQRAHGQAITLGGLLVRLGLVSAGHHCAPFPQGWGEHPFGTQG